ncbi:sn-glycerol-3-phosphate ABC transporter ATP-binding protein UgpC [Polaromonas sp. P2-4]|nr:sn-glycerol-3-phosphate ABC transporter ATP-binding protein UgpC [Polaromonas sp. P2-4]
MAKLSIRNVHKHFLTVPVLKGINIEIEDGEFLILVGPSGCGKSTLLNMIAGLDSTTEGEIVIGDRVVNDVSPKDRDIAMVFQSYALYPSMTVRENIEFAMRMRKVPKAQRDEVVARVAKTLQMDQLLDRRPAQLSGGQRQRVAMGRALARNPVVFLFDEPLSNLDAKLRVEMRAEIKLLHQRLKTTVVYVTHDQVEAMTLGDRIAVMKDGMVQQFGTPEDIYERPSNLYVASFMGSPSMSLLRVTLKNHNGHHTVSFQTSEGQATVGLGVAHNLAWDDREVIMGVRAEHFKPAQANEAGAFQVRIDMIEPTGADTFVYTQINGNRVALRLPPKPLRPVGSTCWVTLDTTVINLFDVTTEQRLTV